MSDGSRWGTFDAKTFAAVNKFKNDYGLQNDRQYYGVVGITTWKKLNLEVNHQYELSSKVGTPELNGGSYINANGPSIENGIQLGSVEAGLVQVEGEYEKIDYQAQAISGQAAAGIGSDFVGVKAGAQLIQGSTGVSLPLPFTDYELYLGVEGILFGAGVNSYIEDGKLHLGSAAIVGGSIVVGIK